MSAVLAFLHHVAAFALVAAIVVEFVLIRMLQVHRKRLKSGVGEHKLASWPTSF